MKTKKNTLDVCLNEKIYKINLKNAKYFISRLSRIKEKDISDEDIIPMLKKYKLLDEIFLKNLV